MTLSQTLILLFLSDLKSLVWQPIETELLDRSVHSKIRQQMHYMTIVGDALPEEKTTGTSKQTIVILSLADF